MPKASYLTPLKPLIVPLWNAAHFASWRLAEYASALRHRRFEHCSVCGRFRPMLFRRRVIPPKLESLWNLTPRQAEALARKESLDCSSCRAKLRARRLASVLLDLYPAGNPPATDLHAWAQTPQAQALHIAEINRIEGLHDQLIQLPHLAASDYHDPSAPGVFDPSAPHEDLTALTYPDDSFDLVLTSETLEHVPDLEAALAEIYRVLKPGGRHLFTIPMIPRVPHTFTRAHLEPDGQITILIPPLLHHPGGDTGYPVFHEFGADLDNLLRKAGFKEVETYFAPLTDDNLAQVHTCRKPVDSPPP